MRVNIFVRFWRKREINVKTNTKVNIISIEIYLLNIYIKFIK